MVSWTSGPNPADLAATLIPTTRQRTVGQAGVPWIGDGQVAYEEAIQTSYRDAVPSGVRPGWDVLRLAPGTALTQAVKHRRGRRLVRVEVRTTIGPVADLPYAVHLERHNGVLRDRLNCLTRKTHAFAKDVATWDAAFSLSLFEHNWLRPHVALRQALPAPVNGRCYRQRTPAMALGLSDHPWSLPEFLTSPVCHRI